LDDVLRVVGALYGVQLGLATTDQQDRAQSNGASVSKRSATPNNVAPKRVRTAAKRAPSRPATRNGSVRSTASTPAPSASDLRTWARTHGLQVSDRGRVSAAIVEAFQEARGR
jgi:hypothetical protein